MNQSKYLNIISLLASLLIASQLIMILTKGESFCLNQGCAVVESLTTISPLTFNLMGLLYFQILFWLGMGLSRTGSDKISFWLSIFLVAGMGVEGILAAYQFFIAETFCSYCLIILAMVLTMNIIAGKVQFIRAASVFAAILTIFSSLNFGPSVIISQGKSLNAGTYASRSCTEPIKELYLIFSEDCPHCHNVLAALQNCNSCDFHFNPVEQITSLELSGATKSPSFSPEINKTLLAMLNIETVPVLLAKNPDGFDLIRGETNILAYIQTACFKMNDPRETSGDNSAENTIPQEISPGSTPEGECSVTTDCDDPAESTTFDNNFSF